MAFDGATECSSINCLKTKKFQDMPCGLTSAELLEKYNGDLTELWNALCCVANDIPEIPEIPDVALDSATWNTEKGGAGEISILSHTAITVPLTTQRVNTNTAVFQKNGNGIKVLDAGVYLAIGGATCRNTAYSSNNDTFDVTIEVDGTQPYFHQWSNMACNDDSDAANAVLHLTLSANQTVSTTFYTERSGGLLSGTLTLVKLS